MPLISVIVPCLNMKPYIEDCIESIMDQELKELEILVVDAGSSDGTLEILRRLAKNDSRIQILHSDKKSYGYQVNLGIMQATGKYISIVDADDKIMSKMYKALYEDAVVSDADYVKGTAKMFYTVSDIVTYDCPRIQFPREEYTLGKISLNPSNFPELLTKDNFLWYGIYKKEFLKNIRLHESPGAAFQDLGGLLQTQMNAQSAIYLQEPFYEYRQDNLEASGYNPRGFEFVWNEYTWAEQFIVNASDEWKESFYRKFYLHTLDRYSAMGASGEFWKNADIYINKIRTKLKAVLSKKIITMESFLEIEREDFATFLENEYRLYDKYSDLYANKKNQIMKIFMAVKGRRAVIFGCGQLGRFLHAQLIKHKFSEVISYCDNSPENQGQNIWNIPVLEPMKAVELYPTACFIIANRKYFEKMKRQLIELGISEKQIYYYTAGVDMRLFGEKFILGR